MGYTKLFNEILASTIWQEPDHIRLTWITLLAMKDERHEVMASVPGLARMANVTIEQCEEALKKFEAPDEYSRSKDHEGRRIEKVDGGWLILNGEKYRRRKTTEERNEYMKTYMRKYRKENDNSEMLNDSLTKLAMLKNVKPVNTTDQIRSDKIRTDKNTCESKDSRGLSKKSDMTCSICDNRGLIRTAQGKEMCSCVKKASLNYSF